MSATNLSKTRPRPATPPPVVTTPEAAPAPTAATVGIVITVDHVYLPLDDSGNVGTAWTVTDVFTTRVSRRTRLTVPADLARFLSERDQAEIV